VEGAGDARSGSWTEPELCPRPELSTYRASLPVACTRVPARISNPESKLAGAADYEMRVRLSRKMLWGVVRHLSILGDSTIDVPMVAGITE
jgi:hypothetical protein